MRTALLLGLITFLATVSCGAPFVRWLREHGIGKRIRLDGPSSHQVKMGTPTMGGILFLAAIILFTLIARIAGIQISWLPLAALVAFALLGAVDDVQGLLPPTAMRRWPSRSASWAATCFSGSR